VSESESRFHFALSEYAVATKNVHFEKGTLLEFANLLIADDQSDFGETVSEAKPIVGSDDSAVEIPVEGNETILGDAEADSVVSGA
jgi:hypothetical protein